METTANPSPDVEQPGRSPVELFERAAEAALASGGEPTDRPARITALLKAVERWQKELTETRRDDVRALRQTMTLAKIGEAIDLSVPRVDQITKGK